ncbi:hypothetical protein GMOD_00005872 [Pyrenophora seminiperda CCB06]|uniref:Uncharacterized protein n=1 Tax=Pyrenophora seminiperda CCB06 TaxID=1302712 RepID=A0A3M7M9Y4_9PLEO|nr:hypothetical protein GMOD_00005872 [Pyrenophora seminiperda CCB06]
MDRKVTVCLHGPHGSFKVVVQEQVEGESGHNLIDALNGKVDLAVSDILAKNGTTGYGDDDDDEDSDD